MLLLYIIVDMFNRDSCSANTDDDNVAGAGLCPPEAAARVQGCRHHQVM